MINYFNELFNSAKSFAEPWIMFLAEDPVLPAGQFALAFFGAVAVFLVFYTTRDAILRSNSFIFMLFSILLAAILPVLGFLIYLLIRPPRTIKEKEIESMLKELTCVLAQEKAKKPKQRELAVKNKS